MSNIRVTYSGLIAFVVGIISVITGIVFTLIVTRRLSPEEFGLWAVIGSMISYFLITEPIISYWSTRQIARGEDIGRTSLVSSTLFSFGSIPIYLILVIFVSSSSNSDLAPMMLAAVLLPVTFISQTLAGINLGHKPHAISYGLLAFETMKIPVGLVLVYFFDMGISGAIFAVTVAYLGKIVIQLYFARVKLKNKLNMQTFRRWIKLSWLPLYTNIGHILWSLDVVLYSIITGSMVGVAYYAVSLTIAGIISHAGLISQALYPKLLAKGTQAYVQENFTRLMYFLIPLFGIAVIFSKYALFALNPNYEAASTIVVLISVRTFFYVLTGVLYQVLMGMENVDVEKNPRYSSLAKSKLFLVPTLGNIHAGIYIVSLSITISMMTSFVTELEMVIWWAVIMSVLQVPFFIYALIQVKKIAKFSFFSKEVAKYVMGTITFVIVFYFTADSIINYQISIFQYLPTLLLELAICIGVYLLVTYVIDKKTRLLFKSIFSEIYSNK